MQLDSLHYTYTSKAFWRKKVDRPAPLPISASWCWPESLPCCLSSSACRRRRRSRTGTRSPRWTNPRSTKTGSEVGPPKIERSLVININYFKLPIPILSRTWGFSILKKASYENCCEQQKYENKMKSFIIYVWKQKEYFEFAYTWDSKLQLLYRKSLTILPILLSKLGLPYIKFW